MKKSTFQILALGIFAYIFSFNSHASNNQMHSFLVRGSAVDRVGEWSLFPLSRDTRDRLTGIRDLVATKTEHVIARNSGAQIEICKDRVRVVEYSPQSYTLSFTCEGRSEGANETRVEGTCHFVTALEINGLPHKSINCRGLYFFGQTPRQQMDRDELWELRSQLNGQQRRLYNAMDAVTHHWL